MVEWKVRSRFPSRFANLLLVTSWSRCEQNFLCEISQRKEDSYLRKITSCTNFMGCNIPHSIQLITKLFPYSQILCGLQCERFESTRRRNQTGHHLTLWPHKLCQLEFLKLCLKKMYSHTNSLFRFVAFSLTYISAGGDRP